MRKKHRVPVTYYTNNDYKNPTKFNKITWNSKQNRQQSAEKQKTSFPKEQIKNGDLRKPTFNKIMTTHE